MKASNGALFSIAIGALFMIGSADEIQAQESTQAGQESRSQQPFVLEREVFDYPSAGRRDPFRQIDPTAELGPRFDDLELSGILHSPSVGSVVVLVDRSTLRRFRVWEGEMIGGARLLRVRPSEADFLVTTFGINRRETLTVKRQQEEQVP